MRSTEVRVRRNGVIAALLLFVMPACVTPPPPEPDPLPPPVVKPPPPPEPKPAPPVYEQKVIVIHQADLHGQFESKQGSTITIRALLMMSKTQPQVGNRGVLFATPVGAPVDSDWIPLGDVEVKKPLDSDGRMQVTITGDDKKFVAPGSKRPTPLARNTRVRLRWEW